MLLNGFVIIMGGGRDKNIIDDFPLGSEVLRKWWRRKGSVALLKVYIMKFIM